MLGAYAALLETADLPAAPLDMLALERKAFLLQVIRLVALQWLNAMFCLFHLASQALQANPADSANSPLLSLSLK